MNTPSSRAGGPGGARRHESLTPIGCGISNRARPVLSVMMTAAELWDLRPQGSNPCRNMRRYRMKPRERFLSPDELKRLGFVLDHAEDRQAAAEKTAGRIAKAMGFKDETSPEESDNARMRPNPPGLF